MASERSVFIKVGAKVDGAVAGLRKVQASVNDLTKSDIKKPQKAFDDLANKGALMGGVVALGIGKAVSSFADFDAQMSAVSAALPDAGAEMEKLRGLAVKLGSDTQFSATEAAAGITEMAKAGVEAGDILNGGLKGALDLAAAAQINVAQASEIAATALNQFGLKGSDLTHVADLYAAAAGKAQGSVQDVALAMKYAGVTASSLGISIEEATGTLGFFAKQGIIGEQAGTTLRAMLLSLTAPSKAGAKAMQEYGISVFDASGNFIGLQGVAEQLHTQLGKVDQATRTAALGQIFGNESMNGAIKLYEGGGAAVAEWAKKVDEAGFASDQAAKQTDNLKGDVERLGGSLETLFIQSGSAASGGLRDLTQGLGVAVDVIARVPGPVVLATSSLAALALTIPKGLSVYRNFAGELDTLGLSLDKISAKAPRVGKALNLLKGAGVITGVAAVAVSIQEVSAASQVADVNVDKLAASLDGLASPRELQGGIADLFRHDGGLLTAREEFVSTSEAIERFNTTAFDAISDGALAATVRLLQPGAEAKFDKYVTQIDAALAQMVGSGRIEQAKASLDALIAGIDDPQVAEAARARFTEYAEAVKNVGNASTESAPKIGETSEAVQDIEQKADDAKKALEDLTATIEGFGSPLAAQRAAQRDYKEAVLGAKEALKSQREELIKTRTAELEKGLGKVSTGPTIAATNAVTSAKLRLTQAEQRLQAVQAKGDKATPKELLSARQAVERANLSLANAKSRAASSGTTKDAELTEKQKKDVEAWADAQIKAGAALDTNTEAGLKNQAALDGIQQRALAAASKTFELTHSQELAAAEVAKGRKDFVQQAIAFGMSSEKANELATNMKLIPKDIMSVISLSGVPTANAQLDTVTGKVTILDNKTAKPKVAPTLVKSTADAAEARIDQIARQRTAFIKIDAGLSTAAAGLIGGINNIGGSIFKRATGGPILGVGTETSDSNVLLASRNEHVWTAAEVKAAGGHAAVAALRKAVLTSGVAFRAQGGPVASSYRQAPIAFTGGGRGPSAAEIGAAVAAQMPPMVSVHSGQDARNAARDAIRTWEWEQVQ